MRKTKHPLLMRNTRGVRVLEWLNIQVNAEVSEAKDKKIKGVSRTRIIEDALLKTKRYKPPKFDKNGDVKP